MSVATNPSFSSNKHRLSAFCFHYREQVSVTIVPCYRALRSGCDDLICSSCRAAIFLAAVCNYRIFAIAWIFSLLVHRLALYDRINAAPGDGA